MQGVLNPKVGTRLDDAKVSRASYGLEGRPVRGGIQLGFLLQNNLFQMNSFQRLDSCLKQIRFDDALLKILLPIEYSRIEYCRVKFMSVYLRRTATSDSPIKREEY